MIFVSLCCFNNKTKIIIIKHIRDITLPDTVYTNWDFEVENNCFYVADWDFLKITVLDSENRVVRTISLMKGRGPGEVIWPEDMSVSSNKIFILHGFGRQVSFFDTSGVFLRSFKVQPQANKIHASKDRVYLIGVDPKTKDTCHTYNLDGKKVSSSVPVFEPDEKNKKYLNHVGLLLFTPSDYFFEGDTLWVISKFKNEIKAYMDNEEIMTIHGPDNVVVSPDIEVRKNDQRTAVASRLFSPTDLAVDKNLVYVSVWNPKLLKHFFHIYNKKSGELIATKVESFSKNTAFVFFEYFNNYFYFYKKSGINKVSKSIIKIKE